MPQQLRSQTRVAELRRVFRSDQKRRVEGITFFRSKESVIKQVRNYIGGHFGGEASIYAVPNLSPQAIGKIELDYKNEYRRPEFRFHFAESIAASAFLRHLPGATVQEQEPYLLRDTAMPQIPYNFLRCCIFGLGSASSGLRECPNKGVSLADAGVERFIADPALSEIILKAQRFASPTLV